MTEEIRLQGHSLSPGVAFAPSCILHASEFNAQNKIQASSDELMRFRRAVQDTEQALEHLIERLKRCGFSQEAELVGTHLAIIHDPMLTQSVEERVLANEKNVESVLEEILSNFCKNFKALPSLRLQKRFEDIEDVFSRILSFLEGSKSSISSQITEGSVIFAKTISPSLATEAVMKGVSAIVTKEGGEMSHAAIVARSRGIPYVSGIDMSSFHELAHQPVVIVDAIAGVVIFHPQEETIKQYTLLKAAHDQNVWKESFSEPFESMTRDGEKISLMASVEGVDDVRDIPLYGLDGVGLYRTEYLVLEHGRLPSEEEQSIAFTEVVKEASGKHVVIRVFDFSIDKGYEQVVDVLPGLKDGKRAIELLLSEPKIFLSHLKALLRASTHGNVSLLFPMVSSLKEFDHCLDLLAMAHLAIQHEGLDIARPRVGAMIEVPSIAFHLDKLAKKVQFFAVGTNDLIQFTLAVDRSSSSFDHRLVFQPGLIRLLAYIIEESEKYQVPLSFCGEMSADPMLAPFFLGLGVREFSVAPRHAATLKRIFASYTIDEAQQIAQKVLSHDSVHENYQYLRERYCQAVAMEAFSV